jgi:chromate transporter
MSDDDATIWALAATFGVLSLFAIGGANAVLPEMHRQAVEVHFWMTSERLTDLFAIALAAPGPNIIIVTLIGWDVAGPVGSLVATTAMIGPTSLLAYFVGQVWERFRFARWRIAVQAGLNPLTIGLVGSTAFVLAREVDTSIAATALTLGTAALLIFTRLHPLIFLGAGAVLGIFGLV